MRNFLTSPTSITSVFIAIMVMFVLFTRSMESGKKMANFDGQIEPYELQVEMSFTPEAFHLAKLQEAGRIAAVKENQVHLRAVKREQLLQLSWQPWIDSIKPISNITNLH